MLLFMWSILKFCDYKYLRFKFIFAPSNGGCSEYKKITSLILFMQMSIKQKIGTTVED